MYALEKTEQKMNVRGLSSHEGDEGLGHVGIWG